MLDNFRLKNCFLHASGDAWGAPTTLIPDEKGYYSELIISERRVPLLSDLTIQEEENCWALSLERVRAMMENREDISHVVIAVNDGRAGAQSLPHVHIHLIGFDRILAGNIQHKFNEIRVGYEDKVRPIADGILDMDFCDIKGFVAARRHLFSGIDGANLYSINPVSSGDAKTSFAFEGWSDSNPASFSVAGLMRLALGKHDRKPVPIFGRFVGLERHVDG